MSTTPHSPQGTPTQAKTQWQKRVDGFWTAFGPACDFFAHVLVFTALAAAIYGLGVLLSVALNAMTLYATDPWFHAIATWVDRGLLILDSVFFVCVVLLSIAKMVKEYLHETH